ncbi:MAG: hypothetical protein AAGG08_08005 [Actinomycetota bacterium]
MAQKSIIAGGVLVAVGVLVTLLSDSSSATSLIPAFIGVVYVVIGLVGRAKPDLNKHLMHGAAALSLLAILGSLGSAIGRGSTGWALFAQLTTVVVAGVFLFFAIQSFRAARLAREAEAVSARRRPAADEPPPDGGGDDDADAEQQLEHADHRDRRERTVATQTLNHCQDGHDCCACCHARLDRHGSEPDDDRRDVADVGRASR